MITLNLSKKLAAATGEMQLRLELSIEAGQLVTLHGKSGAGKTSTFRMLAGLLQPDDGYIEVAGQTWFDAKRKVNLSPQERKIGYVFQDYALFPNMTIRENLQFAVPKNQNAKIIAELIEFMELGQLQDRKPLTLSGGQKQRVALARALVQQPKILLLDEPLSALDSSIRLKLQDYLLQLHQHYELTTMLISHDLGEIFKLSDRVYQLKNGQIIAQGTPDEIFIQQKVSGKFKFTGEVLKIEKEEIVYVVTALVHTNVVKVIAQANEVEDLKVGDKVMLVSKAFNPMLYKLA
ncbi:MAG: sulfate/molybdate ABC transporter ATP-binding protein [Saprospiraceae bacterium]